MAEVIEVQTEVPKTFKIDLNITTEKVNELLSARTGAPQIFPDLVYKDQVRAPEVYKRFNEADAKIEFRKQMVESLHQDWKKKLGDKEADRLISGFKKLAENLDENGAVIFGSVLQKLDFE